MLFDILQQGNLRDFFITFLLSLPVVLLSLSFHESAHGLVAYKLGDPTARNMGRLTLNPMKHLDIFGGLCMLLFGFGWAKPVPVNTRYFKKPKRDMMLTAIAGPISNLLLAVIFALLLRVEFFFADPAALLYPETTKDFIQYFLWQMLYVGITLNITLAVFNLLPIPPLDGSRLFLYLLPPRQYFKVMQYERYISLAMMLALFVGLLDTPIRFVSNIFYNWIIGLIF